jgi:hypothetical protein
MIEKLIYQIELSYTIVNYQKQKESREVLDYIVAS